MASIQEILKASDGSLQKAENIALQQAANGKPEFWLDLSLILSVQGKFTGARQAQSQYLKAFPDCPRVRFAMAPFALADGELQSGLSLLEFGRPIDCWGGVAWQKLHVPVWDGQKNIQGKRLLLHMEGGLGDEILNIRATHWAEERGAKCVALCSKDVMGLFSSSSAAAIIGPDSSQHLQCDYWLPAMSAPRLFNRTWETLWPGQYLFSQNEKLNKTWRQIIPKVPGKLSVGLRWQGNPQFEHEQLRRFDPKFLFNAAENSSIIRWSLQKDADTNLPDDVNDLEPFLSSWEHTAAAMSQLDLVITSCTSIAHLAGAMNIPCWTIVPVMPYYYAARPGPKTDWYPSMRIYRQECYSQWDEPFKQVKRDLEQLIQGEKS